MCAHKSAWACTIHPLTGYLSPVGGVHFSWHPPQNIRDDPTFTLSVLSTGGPATRVTWRRDGALVGYDSAHVLTQTVVHMLTATYVNELTVTGREPGYYRYTIGNSRCNISGGLYVSGECISSCRTVPIRAFAELHACNANLH